MKASAAVWLVLLTASCWGNTGSREEESATEDYDNSTATPMLIDSDYNATYDYGDYNYTFDYDYVTGVYPPESRNQAVAIGRFSPVLLLGLAAHHIWT